MEPLPTHTSERGSRRPATGRPSIRRPLGARKRFERQAARGRIAALVQRRPTAEQQSFDPLLREGRAHWRPRVALALGIVGSLLVHAGVVGIGSNLRGGKQAARHDEVKIEMRQRPPDPPPEKKPPPPEPAPKPATPPPKAAKPPPAPPPPVEAPKPVRVVGLSMESTTEGGSGPSFAVGNTRLGETADRAVAPKDLTALPGEPGPPAPAGPGKSNRAASHIPVAGVKYEKPKRIRPKQPPYPATLRSQAIESQVDVLVDIDVRGKVTKVTIVKESPYPEFNEAARATALAEEYEPATRDGVPMPYSLPFQYRFRLDDE